MIATPARALFFSLLATLTLELSGLEATHGAAKKEDPWIEVRSPHFTVVSDAGEKKARRTAGDFERIRAVFLTALPKARDDGSPIVVLATKGQDGLKELLPQYWERKGRRPGGVFQRGFDKHFVVLRLDGRAHERYRLIYHEYFHLLASLNEEKIPTWMNEGLAKFWERTRIRGKSVDIGMPIGREVFERNSMLPLEELIGMKENPHDTDPNKVSIFYAQSWALIHYLLLGDENERTRPALSEYLQLVQDNVNSVEAARRSFGDLDTLQEKLEGYVGSRKMTRGLRIDAPAKIDEKAYPARELSPAESAAVRGSFLVASNRPYEAQEFLEKALRLDAKNPLAHESMGYLEYRRNKRKLAKSWFEDAVGLGTGSYISHYYYAVLATENDVEDAGAWARAEGSLKRAVDINPRFGPGYGQLAYEYVRRGENLEEAIGIARRSVELEPQNVIYLVNTGKILLRLNRLDEAREVGGRVAAVATTAAERQMAKGFLTDLNAYGPAVRLANSIYYDGKGADLQPWVHQMVTEVQRWWKVPGSDAHTVGHVSVEASIDRSGQILEVRVKKGSNNSVIDEAAERALRQAGLAPLPDDYPDEIFEFILVFWYNQKPTT